MVWSGPLRRGAAAFEGRRWTQRWRHQLERTFDRVDVIVTPATSITSDQPAPRGWRALFRASDYPVPDVYLLVALTRRLARG